MIPPNLDANTSLCLKRVFAASREKMFHAWTDPDMIPRWIGGQEFEAISAQVDLRTGGTYRIQLQTAQHAPIIIIGEYHDVQIPEKLVYTWMFEAKDTNKTLVTVLFREIGTQTEITLTHERFPDSAIRDNHETGWHLCFDRLEQITDKN